MLLFSFSCGYKHVNENSITAGPMKAVIGEEAWLICIHTKGALEKFGRLRSFA